MKLSNTNDAFHGYSLLATGPPIVNALDVVRVQVGLPIDTAVSPLTTAYYDEQLRTGIALGAHFARLSERMQFAIAYDPAYQFPTNDSVIEVFGQKRATSLVRGQSVTFDGFVVELATPTAQSWPPSGVVVAIHPLAALLEKLHEARAMTHLIVVPWYDADLTCWQQTWGPKLLTNNEWSQLPTLKIADRAVLKAINGITRLSRNLSDKSDEQSARQTFADLRSSGCLIETDQVRAHILRNSRWRVGDADTLVAIAAG